MNRMLKAILLFLLVLSGQLQSISQETPFIRQELMVNVLEDGRLREVGFELWHIMAEIDSKANPDPGLWSINVNTFKLIDSLTYVHLFQHSVETITKKADSVYVLSVHGRGEPIEVILRLNDKHDGIIDFYGSRLVVGKEKQQRIEYILDTHRARSILPIRNPSWLIKFK